MEMNFPPLQVLFSKSALQDIIRAAERFYN